MWVAGAARSALNKLVGLPFKNYELIKIPNEKKEIKIEIHSVGLLKDDSHALGITFAKSGLDLDITQNLEIWAIASFEKISFKNPVQTIPINIIAGSGVKKIHQRYAFPILIIGKLTLQVLAKFSPFSPITNTTSPLNSFWINFARLVLASSNWSGEALE